MPHQSARTPINSRTTNYALRYELHRGPSALRPVAIVRQLHALVTAVLGNHAPTTADVLAALDRLRGNEMLSCARVLGRDQLVDPLFSRVSRIDPVLASRP